MKKLFILVAFGLLLSGCQSMADAGSYVVGGTVSAVTQVATAPVSGLLDGAGKGTEKVVRTGIDAVGRQPTAVVDAGTQQVANLGEAAVTGGLRIPTQVASAAGDGGAKLASAAVTGGLKIPTATLDAAGKGAGNLTRSAVGAAAAPIEGASTGLLGFAGRQTYRLTAGTGYVASSTVAGVNTAGEQLVSTTVAGVGNIGNGVLEQVSTTAGDTVGVLTTAPVNIGGQAVSRWIVGEDESGQARVVPAGKTENDLQRVFNEIRGKE